MRLPHGSRKSQRNGGSSFKFIFAGNFLAYLGQLLLITHHDPEMAQVRGLNFFHLENREELVLAEFEKRVALAAIQFLEIEKRLCKTRPPFDMSTSIAT